MAEESILPKAIEIISSGVFGAFVAYAFNLFHWFSTEKIRKTEQLCNSIYTIIDKIEDSSIRYWLTAPDDSNGAITKQLEISIKSLLRTQISLTESLAKLSKKPSRIKTLQEAQTLNNRLFELSTGDDFESKCRRVRPTRCHNISRACAEIRFKLAELTL